MPWSGSGSFTRNYSWVTDAANGIDITASRVDADTNDITATGFGNCLTRDGQGIATAVLPMGGFRHTGVGNGVARTDYAAMGQLQDQIVGFAIAAGTGTYTATLAPAITSYVDGAQYCIRFTNTNSAAAPTLNLNGLGAKTLVGIGGIALAAGAILAGSETLVRYVSANSQFVVIGATNYPVLLTAGTATAVSSFGITSVITGAFSNYQLRLTHIQITSATGGPVNVEVRGSTNNGSSYIASGYSTAILAQVSGNYATSTSGVPVYRPSGGPFDEDACAIVDIVHPAVGGRFESRCSRINSAAIDGALIYGLLSSSGINAIQVAIGAGAFTANYELWGYP